jgi:hypothetical protein
MYQALIFELSSHLVDQGFTWSIEDNKPPTLRDGIKAEVLLTNLLDYMIGAGYASPTKVL